MFSLHNLGLTNVLSNLTRLTTQIAVSNERITTGYKVNRASDDPTGIISINSFNAQIARIESATSSGTRINRIIDAADADMSTIETHLTTIETAVTSASGDPANLATYQTTIDTALDAIDSLVNTTKYNGTTLLNGDIGYSTSGVDTDDIDSVRIHSADTTGGSLTVEIAAVAAEKAIITYQGLGNLTEDITFTLTGNLGSHEFNFLAGTTRSDIVTAVNLETANTGVESSKPGWLNKVVFRSTTTGPDQSV